MDKHEATPEAMGQRLQQARIELNYNQSYVAFRLGLPTAEIAEIEAGKRKISTLQISMLASLYGRTIKYLVLGEEDAKR